MDWLAVVLWVAGGLLVLAGFAGCVLPALPGPAFVFAGIVLVAWAGRFERIGPWTLVALGVFALALAGVDLAASTLGVKRFGGTKWGMGGAAVGVLVGLFFAPLGLVLGPLAGAVAGEMLGGRRAAEATRAGWGAFVGFLAGTVVKLAACVGMVACAAVAHFV